MVTSAHRTTRYHIPPVALLAFAALLARLIVVPFFGYRYDVSSYLEWSAYLAHHPLSGFYAASLATPPDHLPGDLLIFALLGRVAILIDPGFQFSGLLAEMLVRLVPITSDILLGLLVYRTLRGRVVERRRLLAITVVYFNPALFTVSAIWGQWDSFAALLLVATILLALGDPRRGALVWPLLAFLVLIKPQTIVFAPLLLIAQLRIATELHRTDRPATYHGWEPVLQRLVIGMIGAAAVFFAVATPFGVGIPGQPGIRWTIFDRIHFTINRYTDIALGAHNLWAMLGFGYGDTDRLAVMGTLNAQTIGIVLLVVASLGTVLVTIAVHPPPWALWTASFVLAMSIYCFPTRVHERYMLPAIVCLCFMWPFLRALLPILIAFSLTYAISLVFSMRGETFGGERMSSALAAINLVLFVTASTIAIRAGHPAIGFSLHKRPFIQHHRA